MAARMVCRGRRREARIEGGILQGMSRALYEQVKWNANSGIITSTDWNSYPVYQWGQTVPVW